MLFRSFNREISEEQEKFMQENCEDYWTITDLKQQAETDKYREKVYKCRSSFKEVDTRENE